MKHMKKRLAPLLLLLVIPACTSTQAEPEVTRPKTDATPDTIEARPESSARGLNRLTFEVELRESSVRAGGEAILLVTISNKTDKTIIDPGCYLGQTSAAIIPEGAPDAELWLQVIVDCGGAFKMKPGFEEVWKTDLYARTKFGEDLTPGRYIAALESRGVDRRFELPIEVTE